MTDTPAAARAMAENMGGMLGVPPEVVRTAPLSLLGTPEECVAELQRRRREWGVSEFVFWVRTDDVIRRLGEQVLPHLC